MTIVIDYEVVLILQHPLSVIFIIIFSPKTNGNLFSSIVVYQGKPVLITDQEQESGSIFQTLAAFLLENANDPSFLYIAIYQMR